MVTAMSMPVVAASAGRVCAPRMDPLRVGMVPRSAAMLKRCKTAAVVPPHKQRRVFSVVRAVNGEVEETDADATIEPCLVARPDRY
jgi:hypothetical protein